MSDTDNERDTAIYPAPLTCDMVDGCDAPVTHIDIKGYIYCAAHGAERRSTCRCRKLTANELNILRAGEPLSSY